MAITWKKVAFEDNVVTKALFDAHSVIASVSDNDPAQLTVGEQTLVGRLTGGNISAVAVGIADNNILQVDHDAPANNDYARFTAAGIAGREKSEVLSDLNVADGADVTASNAPQAHHDLHDPQDGSDALDCAAPSELAGVQAAGEGSAHDFARADHAHQIQESFADDHLVTINAADVAANDYARFTAAGGLCGLTAAEVAATMALDDIGAGDAALDMNGQDIENGGVIFLTEQAEAEADVEAKGQIWVNTATPNELWFTDDAGTDTRLGLGAAHAILDGDTHSDSVADAVTRGSIIYGNATPKWDELVIGAADTFLGSDGTDLSYRTAAQVMASLSGEAAAAFDLGGQELQEFVVHTVANAAGRPTAAVGKVIWQSDELSLYACTVAA